MQLHLGWIKKSLAMHRRMGTSIVLFSSSCQSLPFAGPSEWERRCWLPHQFSRGLSRLDRTEILVFMRKPAWLPMQDRFDLDPQQLEWVMASTPTLVCSLDAIIRAQVSVDYWPHSDLCESMSQLS